MPVVVGPLAFTIPPAVPFVVVVWLLFMVSVVLTFRPGIRAGDLCSWGHVRARGSLDPWRPALCVVIARRSHLALVRTPAGRDLWVRASDLTFVGRSPFT